MATVREIVPGTAAFVADLSTLNDSGVDGTAFVTVDDQDQLDVHIQADGLEEGQPHAQHIHGRFDADGDGNPDVADGIPLDSVNPTLDEDTDGDGFIEVSEGAPAYGPIILPLDNEDGSFPTADDGSIAYNRSFDLNNDEPFQDPLNNIDFEGEDVLPLDQREIVLHGRSVPDGAGSSTGGEVDGTGGYKAVLPVASGELEEFALPAGVSTLVLGESGEETVTGTDQNDLVFGAAANTVLSGNAGDDVLRAADASTQTFTVDLEQLSGSGVTGTAEVTLDRASNELTVQIDAAGLQPGQPHAQHIHGRFDSDGDGQPDAADGTPVDSINPTSENDTDGDGFIEVSEGAPAYGPIILPLTNEDGSFPTAPDGSVSYTRTFDLTDDALFEDPLNGIDFEGEDVLPLDQREIVLHGRSVPDGAGSGTGGEVDGTGGYKAVLPVASGTIEPAASADGSDGFILYGNQGADIVYGSQALDTLFGGQDADTLFGGQATDIVYGNLANDTLHGNKGNDVLYGGQGDDLLHGDESSDDPFAFDLLFGNLGNDTLVGGQGVDWLFTGEGADQIDIGDANGYDVLADFDGAAGDRVAISSNLNETEIDTFEELLAASSATAEGGTVIDLGSNFIRIENTSPGDLQSGWFFFT